MKYSELRALRSLRVVPVACAFAAAFVVGGATFLDGRTASGDHSHDHDEHGHLVAAHAVVPSPVDEIGRDSLTGLSGMLRMRFVRPGASSEVAALTRLFGEEVTRRPGMHTVPLDGGETFSFVTLRPFQDKVGGRIGTYRIGNWPHERSRRTPPGFIEVTRENQNTYVSKHFRLRDFLTKDQFDVWPKYLVLDERLIDKLELVILDLKERGYNVQRMSVMSGFRTPQYNARGVGKGGRASDSRHQYGDAADIFVDNNGNGRMDDLNGDGRVDQKDALIMLESVERVERRYPHLVGGAGVYRANPAHGPFIHVDARGNRARWGLN